MDSNLKKKLRSLSLDLRHILERDGDTPGDLHLRLNELGIWPDRPAKSLDELVLTEADRIARETVDAFVTYRQQAGVSQKAAFDEFVRECAYSWANRLFTLRCMEARSLIDPVILQQQVYGGRSLIHHRFSRENPAACTGEDDGLFDVLTLEFQKRVEELPALFDPDAPAISLRPSISALKRCIGLLSGTEEDDALFQAGDTLGWAYQFWNAEEKDRVFERVRTEKGAKIEGADLIPATQLYTEPYMVKFLVQNSLGALWAGMYPESKLPIEWEYYLRDADRTPPVHPDPAPFDVKRPPKPGPDPWLRPNAHIPIDPDIVAYAHTLTAKAPTSEPGSFVDLRNQLLDAVNNHSTEKLLDLNHRVCEAWDREWPARRPKLRKRAAEITFLDPACGSGHFLLEAFDLLYDMYVEEAPGRPSEEICASILNHNLFGVDIDERAIQIAHAALWMHARERSELLKPQLVTGMSDHLVAANLALPKDGTHLKAFLEKNPQDAPLRPALEAVFQGLSDADQLGTLLRVDKPVEQALQRLKDEDDRREAELLRESQRTLVFLPEQYPLEQSRPKRDYNSWKHEILDRLTEHFRQEAAVSDPVRRFFGREARQGLALFDLLARRYDVVAANPPYMGRDKSTGPLNALLGRYVGGADLYGAFIERAFELATFNGFIGILSLANYLHGNEFTTFRELLLRGCCIHSIVNLSNKTFEALSNPNAFYFCMSVFINVPPTSTHIYVVDLVGTEYEEKSILLKSCLDLPTDHTDRRFMPRQDSFFTIPDVPIAYRLPEWGRLAYLRKQYVSSVAEARQGLSTGQTERYLRYRWECSLQEGRWYRHAKGGTFRRWWGNDEWAIDWESFGVRIKHFTDEDGKLRSAPRNTQYFFRDGCAWSSQTISAFGVRRIEPESCFDTTGSTAFPKYEANVSVELLMAVFNSPAFGSLFSAIQPGVHFGEGYLEKLPFPLGLLAPGLSTIVRECIEHQKTADQFNLLSEQYSPRDRRLTLAKSVLCDLLDQTSAELKLHLAESRIWDEVEQALGVPQSEMTTARRFREGSCISQQALLEQFASSRGRPTLESWRATQNSVEELSATAHIHPQSLNEQLLPALVAASEWSPTLRPRLAERVQSCVEAAILSTLGHRWQTQACPETTPATNSVGIIPLREMFSMPSLQRQISARLNAMFESDPAAEFEQLVGVSLARWLESEFFARHISQFLSRPIVWQLQTRTLARSNAPVFSCLVYYHRLRGALPNLRTAYVGKIRGNFESEFRTLETLTSLTAEQGVRKGTLHLWIEEVTKFQDTLEEIEARGFATESLRTYAISDGICSMTRRWLCRLRDQIRQGPLAVWRDIAAADGFPPDLPSWVAAAVDKLDRQCVALAPEPPPPETPDDLLITSAFAQLFAGQAAAMVGSGVAAICRDWRAQYDKAVLQPLKDEAKAAEEAVKTLPETVENVLRRKELKAEIKKLKKMLTELTAKAKILASQIQEWQCPEAELWNDWLSSQPLYDEIASLDGRRQAPATIAEFVSQESQYQPDINDGVRVNIAPLQKAGILARDVLAAKDVDKAIADRAEWRADERRWVRQGFLPQPGWWAPIQDCSYENEAGR